MTTHHLPTGYHSRVPTLADAQPLADMIVACDIADFGTSDTNVDEVLADWEEVNFDEEAVAVVAQDGTLAAYVDISPNGYASPAIYGYVHPEHRGHGLGTWLVRWAEDWALRNAHRSPENARITVRHYVVHTNHSGRALFDALGYEPLRVVYYMSVSLGGPLAEPIWSEGIRLRVMTPGQDERSVYETIEEAFQDHWSHPPSTFEEWIATMQVELRDPGLWTIAEDEHTGEVAGACISRIVAEGGWIPSIGVRRPWRRQGIALAMLLRTLHACRERGARDVALSVDSESLTGAPRVYLTAGFRVDRSYIVYYRELRAGAEISLNASRGAEG